VSYIPLTGWIQKSHVMQFNTASKGATGSKLQTIGPSSKRKKSEVEYSSNEDLEQAREEFNRMQLVSAGNSVTDQEMD
jgi:hypothetical protein